MSQQEESSVELTDESLRIQNLEIEDEDVIDYLSDNDDRPLEELIRLSIKVGVSNLRLSDTSKEVEYIRHEFDKINRDLKEEIDELRDELDGWFDGEEGDFSELTSSPR